MLPQGSKAVLMPDLLIALVVGAAVGCGATGGLLFAFSNVVMTALARQTAECGIRTMQTINVAILNPLFLSLFLGTAAAAAAILVTLLAAPASSGMLEAAGAALYLVGVFGVTMMVNVPLNNALEALPGGSPEAARFWPVYVRRWTQWNHVRTVCALVASVLLTLAAALS
jgi:uncharacterized membrane protein